MIDRTEIIAALKKELDCAKGTVFNKYGRDIVVDFRVEDEGGDSGCFRNDRTRPDQDVNANF